MTFDMYSCERYTIYHTSSQRLSFRHINVHGSFCLACGMQITQSGILTSCPSRELLVSWFKHSIKHFATIATNSLLRTNKSKIS